MSLFRFLAYETNNTLITLSLTLSNSRHLILNVVYGKFMILQETSTNDYHHNFGIGVIDI